MTDRSFQILGSPGFLIGLSLLLTNDFVLKEQFHNGFTGKLSDFAGLFVFSIPDTCRLAPLDIRSLSTTVRRQPLP